MLSTISNNKQDLIQTSSNKRKVQVIKAFEKVRELYENKFK